MRILRGHLKGRTICCPPGVRPVSMRIRKACFDMLSDVIDGGCILDLFAGAGSLGIEALSCGAQHVVFNDGSRRNIASLRKTISLLNLGEKATLLCKDALKCVNDLFLRGAKFDCIFVDPPYSKGLMRKTLQALGECDILTGIGYIAGFCYEKDDLPNVPQGTSISNPFSLIRDKKYGQTRLVIFEKKNDNT